MCVHRYPGISYVGCSLAEHRPPPSPPSWDQPLPHTDQIDVAISQRIHRHFLDVNHNIKTIAFDADDTLWINEPYFQDAQKKFADICADWIDAETVIDEHYKTEIQNIPVFGYGIKGFTLSLIETAIRISNGTVSAEQIQQIIQMGKSMLQYPIELLPEVEDTLKKLSPHYRIVVATKGDLMDQERKLERSGIAHYFHHVEVMSEKNEAAYHKLISHLDIKPEEFLMVGNALKSDILPVLSIGANAIHVPFAINWIHEQVEDFTPPKQRFRECKSIAEVCNYLSL